MRHAEQGKEEEGLAHMFTNCIRTTFETHLSEVEFGVLWLLNTFDLEKSCAWVRVVLTTLVAGDASLYV